MKEEITLFCIPYAGAGFNAYAKLEKFFNSRVDVVTLESPGRGLRMAEAAVSSITELACDYYDQIHSYGARAYAIYGHSLGAIIALEVVKKIESDHEKLPCHLFLSGMNSPSSQSVERRRSELSKSDLIATLKEYGGSPEEVFQDETLFDFLEPIIRSDFKALDDFTYIAGTPINVPISIAYGSDDKNTELERLKPWGLETSSYCEFVEFDGGHFFIFERPEEFASFINEKLTF